MPYESLQGYIQSGIQHSEFRSISRRVIPKNSGLALVVVQEDEVQDIEAFKEVLEGICKEYSKLYSKLLAFDLEVSSNKSK